MTQSWNDNYEGYLLAEKRQREGTVIRPARTDPFMKPTEGYRFFIVDLDYWELPKDFPFTKNHSCYLRFIPNKVGVCIDYRTAEKAQRMADICNQQDPEGNYVVCQAYESLRS